LDKHAFMRACREGGVAIEEALRALDRSLFAVLYRECHRAIHDDEMARDLVQETFIKVWWRCATFRGDSELLPWIRSILRHTIVDRVRQRGPEVPMEEEGEMSREADRGLAALSASAASAQDEVQKRERDDCLARCWKRFESAAPAHAAVMTWIVEDGLSNEQIAALLGRTPGATREFISQCRKRARIYLADWYALVTVPGDPA
jgi:RNA polymerase sigma-70 factor (ECF subfamily)